MTFEEWKRIYIHEPAAERRRLQALNDEWYAAGKYERFGCDAFGVSFVLVSSEQDDKWFETEADYQQAIGNKHFRGVQG